MNTDASQATLLYRKCYKIVYSASLEAFQDRLDTPVQDDIGVSDSTIWLRSALGELPESFPTLYCHKSITQRLCKYNKKQCFLAICFRNYTSSIKHAYYFAKKIFFLYCEMTVNWKLSVVKPFTSKKRCLKTASTSNSISMLSLFLYPILMTIPSFRKISNYWHILICRKILECWNVIVENSISEFGSFVLNIILCFFIVSYFGCVKSH